MAASIRAVNFSAEDLNSSISGLERRRLAAISLQGAIMDTPPTRRLRSATEKA